MDLNLFTKVYYRKGKKDWEVGNSHALLEFGIVVEIMPYRKMVKLSFPSCEGVNRAKNFGPA